MSSKFLSALEPISYGLVAENKLLDSDEILVIPVEITPYVTGDVSADIEELESKGTDSEEKEYTIRVKKSKVIKAKWLKWGSGRHTSPDVRRDMRVMIYRFGDSSKYYWTSLGLDDHLMRLETVQWLFSDDPDGTSNVDKNPDNSIAITISTHNKHITISTPDTNGEKFKYVIKLDLAESIFTLTDDAGNYMFLDSDNTHIKFRNADETLIELDKEDINFHAPNDVSLIAGENFNVQCKNYSVTVDENLTIETGSNTSFTVGDSWSVEASSVSMEAATISLVGKLTVDGMSEFTQPMTAMGITSSVPIAAKAFNLL